MVLGSISGRPPALDLERERALLDLLHEAARADLLASAHDCGDGGLAVTLAEQAILGGHGFVGLDPGRPPAARRALLRVGVARGRRRGAGARWRSWPNWPSARGVPFLTIGETGGPRVVFDGLFETTMMELRDVYEHAIPHLLGEDA